MTAFRDFSASQGLHPTVRNIDAHAPMEMRQQLVDVIFAICENNEGTINARRIYEISLQSLGQTMAAKNYYAILGVSRDASQDEIHKAYRKLARTYHPDIKPGNKKAEERFKEISAAHEVLGETAKRKLYDNFDEARLATGFAHTVANPYGDYRHAVGRDIRQVPWERVYDLIGKLWHEFQLAKLETQYREAVNQILAGHGVFWELDESGKLKRVLPLATQSQIDTAIQQLGHPRFEAASARFDAARDPFDDRPRRDCDARSNVFDALESVAKVTFNLRSATFGLFIKTKDRWNWKKLMLWPVAALVIISVAVYVDSSIQNRPRVEKAFWDIPLNATKADVKFIKGEPSEEEKDRWSYFATDGEGKLAAVYYVNFADDKVWAISYSSAKEFDWHENIQGIGIGMHSDGLAEKFGEPSHVTISSDELARIYTYADYNVLFQLEKNKVTRLGVYNPKVAKHFIPMTEDGQGKRP